MFGMDAMSAAVSGLKDVESFRSLFIAFENPLLGVLAGALLTAIIQVQLRLRGNFTGSGRNRTSIIRSGNPYHNGTEHRNLYNGDAFTVGTNKNAKRAAIVHLAFNVIGTIVWLTVFWIIKAIFAPALLNESASLVGIAIAHSVFNILCTALLLPLSGILETVAYRIVPETKTKEEDVELDELLLATPSLALENCHSVASEMAETSASALKDSIGTLTRYSTKLDEEIREKESKTDHYEDILGTYLIKLSSNQASEEDSAEAAKLLKMIGDFERISDHAVNILESAEEMNSKDLKFSESAMKELGVLTDAVEEILDLALRAFLDEDVEAASKVEPLEEVIDGLKEQMRTRHILRLQQGDCSIDAGFVWSDLLTNLERTADHCSNIAVCVLEAGSDMNIHESLHEMKAYNDDFKAEFEKYAAKYSIAK